MIKKKAIKKPSCMLFFSDNKEIVLELRYVHLISQKKNK